MGNYHIMSKIAYIIIRNKVSIKNSLLITFCNGKILEKDNFNCQQFFCVQWQHLSYQMGFDAKGYKLGLFFRLCGHALWVELWNLPKLGQFAVHYSIFAKWHLSNINVCQTCHILWYVYILVFRFHKQYVLHPANRYVLQKSL